MRCLSAMTLGRIGIEAKTAVLALTELLRDREWEVRYHAALALGQMGTEAKTAIPGLRALVQDEQWYVARTATDSLRRISEQGAAAD